MDYKCVSLLNDDQRKVVASANFIVGFSGSILNLFSLYCMWMGRKLQKDNSSNRLLWSLNLCDTVNCTLFLPYAALFHWFNLRGNCWALSFYTSFNIANVIYSSSIIIFISLRRYISVSRFNNKDSILPKQSVDTINIWILIVSIISSIIALFSIEFVKFVSTLFLCLVSIGIPVLYVLLAKAVRKIQTTVSCETSVSRRKRNNIRVVGNVQLLIAFCFASYFPLLVVSLASIVIRNTPEMYFAARIGIIAMSLNSCSNPVLYVLKNEIHKRVWRRLFRRTRVGDI